MALAQPRSTGKPEAVGSETHTWNGVLIDATRTNCGAVAERAVTPGSCPVSMHTTNFALKLTDGQFVKFDEGGNTKAVYALRKSRHGSKIVFDYWKTGKVSKALRATVTGTLTSDTLNVESIKVD
jgi:hypothetical protein